MFVLKYILDDSLEYALESRRICLWLIHSSWYFKYSKWFVHLIISLAGIVIINYPRKCHIIVEITQSAAFGKCSKNPISMPKLGLWQELRMYVSVRDVENGKSALVLELSTTSSTCAHIEVMCIMLFCIILNIHYAS